MTRQFSSSGFDIVASEDEADVYVVNSCTVTASGDKKSRQALRRMRRQNPAAVLCLCGCFPQAFPADAECIPEADIIMGAKNRSLLLGAVRRRLAGEGRIVCIEPHEKNEAFEPMRADSMEDKTRAFIKIQDGCERFCAYCVIPRARGPVRSKPLSDLRAELETLAASGYREAVLTGINLSSYGLDIGLALLDAVRAACDTPGIRRVRLGSLEPELLTDSDIKEMAELSAKNGAARLCPQFHLSLQSGCDSVLRRMRRHYDSGEYRRIVSAHRAAFPGCAITTDIMTGFPGETEEEHRESLLFAEDIGFARAHIFAFSPRPGTLAANMPDQIPGAVKLRRSRELIEASDKTRMLFWQKQCGTTAPVLFESRAGGLWHGYTENYTPVAVQFEGDLSGAIHNALITGTKEKWCSAQLEAGHDTRG